MFDFSNLEEHGFLIVHCKTPEESRMFWDEVFQRYSNVTWSECDVRSVIKTGHAKYRLGICYNLALQRAMGKIFCTWDQRSYFKSRGYEVYNFSELMHISYDLGEISCEEIHIDALLT